MSAFDVKRREFIRLLAGAISLPVVGSAYAFSPNEHSSFTLKLFGYDAVIFYQPRVGQGGLSTTIGIDQRYEVKVNPSEAEEIQRRADKAQEIELVYSPGQTGSTAVDLFAKIPATKPIALSVYIGLQRTPVIGEIGNLKILSAVEQLSEDPDSSHFGENGYRLLTEPVPNLIMQRSRYSRPGGRPFFLLRQTDSANGPVFSYTGDFLYGQRARVRYHFRYVAKEHWVALDKAVYAFVSAILTPPNGRP
jgi:hypothetical protein